MQSNIMYKNDKIVNKKYLTHQFKQFPQNQNDIYVVITKNTRLDILANKYYKDQFKWWIIANANHIPCDSLVLSNIGQTIRIPFLER